MRIKESLVVFLAGLVLGIGISPYLVSPTAGGVVLGATVESPIPKQSLFGELLNELDSTQSSLIKDDKVLIAQDLIPAKLTEEKEKKIGKLTIAVLGDSMVDTMGPGLPYLEKALRNYYPNYQFNLLNYGAGGTNIEYGIIRLTSDYDYLGKRIPSLVSASPDIVIVESFAYNPWGGQKSDLDHHWLALARMVDILKSKGHAKIIFLATIAANKVNFGAGPNGVNWSKAQAWEHADKINKYLDNTVKFAQSQNIPIIDAFHPSLAHDDGNLIFINPGDHIHPSVAGCQFIANLIAQKLNQLGWI